MKKKDVFISVIKGFITGISSWVNNVSISSMFLSTNSYESFINGFAKNKKNNSLWYITIPILIGICFGLIAGHNLIQLVWRKYQLQTIVFFIGLFIGGIKVILIKQKLEFNKTNILISTIILILFILFIIITNNKKIEINNNLIKTIVLGLITGISFLLPGTTILSSKIKGSYNLLLKAIKNITIDKNILIIILFTVVCIITLIFASKIISKLLENNKNNLYIILCSLITSNIIILISEIKPISINFVNIFTSLLTFLWGYIFAINVEKE